MTHRAGPRTTSSGAGDPEAGAAMVEYTVLVAFFLVPLVYLILLLAEIQSAAFASTASAREAARVTVAEVTDERPGALATGQAAGRLTAEDFGQDAAELTLECTGCDEPGDDGGVTASSRLRVTLPGLDRLGIRGPAVLTITATHTEPLDEYRAGGGQR
ncbi:hypothetical protein [Kytococcus sp. Marseille-QA3725]